MKRFLKIALTVIILLAVLAGVFVGYVFYSDTHVKVTNYDIVSSKIDETTDGGKIAVIADYHNSDNYEQILKKTSEAEVDVIIIAGDYINMDDTDFTNARELMKGLVKIAPVYYVSGNHERWLKYGEDRFLVEMETLGAKVINNRAAEVSVKDGKIAIYGFEDLVYADNKVDDYADELEEQLQDLYDLTDEHEDMFNLLVFHRGHLLDYAAEYKYDLIVSGHLHGGQVNISGVREKVIEEKTSTPAKYIKGYYKVNGVKCIISGGMENKNEIRRIFNMPEVVVVTLNSIK